MTSGYLLAWLWPLGRGARGVAALLLTVLLVGAARVASAQANDGTRRLEIAATPAEQRMEVLPIAADSSVLIYADFRRRHEGDAQKHQFTLYNPQLRQRWQTAVHLPAGTELRALAADGSVPYALCTTDADARELLVLRFEPVSGSARVFHYRLTVPIEPLSFEVSGEDAYVVATVFRQQTVLRLPLRDSAGGVFLPILTSPATSVADAVPEPGGLAVLTAERLPETARLLLRAFQTTSPIPTALRVLQGPHPASLTAGRTVAVAAATPRLVVGTYATRDPRFAQGIFSTVLAPASEAGATDASAPQILYYDLPTLPHYYDRFRPRHRARAIERARRRRAAGRETVAHARLLLHRPLPLPDGGYALVAEQYYPRYRGGESWGYRSFSTLRYPGLTGFAYGLPGLYGTYDPTNVWDRGLDGYAYTQALVLAFDAAGRLRWQNSFVLGNLTRPDLRANVAATVLPGGAVALAVPSENGERIRHLVLAGTTLAPEKPQETSLLTPSATQPERLLDAHDTRVHAWYPGHLLSVGFQRIRPVGQREREVFVVQEVRFQQP